MKESIVEVVSDCEASLRPYRFRGKQHMAFYLEQKKKRDDDLVLFASQYNKTLMQEVRADE